MYTICMLPNFDRPTLTSMISRTAFCNRDDNQALTMDASSAFTYRMDQLDGVHFYNWEDRDADGAGGDRPMVSGKWGDENGLACECAGVESVLSICTCTAPTQCAGREESRFGHSEFLL